MHGRLRKGDLPQNVIGLGEEFAGLARGCGKTTLRDYGLSNHLSDITAEIDWTDFKPSASVSLVDGVGKFKFGIGLVMAILDLTNAIAYNSSLLSDLVDFGPGGVLQQREPRDFGWFADYEAELVAAIESGRGWGSYYTVEEITPRVTLAILLFECLEMWVICHEISHLILGHHAVIRSAVYDEAGTNAVALGMREFVVAPGFPSIGYRHVLEMEADAVGMQILLKTMEGAYGNKAFFTEDGLDRRAVESSGPAVEVSQQILARTLIASTTMMGFLLGASGGLYQWSRHHPSPHLRMRAITQRVQDTFKNVETDKNTSLTRDQEVVADLLSKSVASGNYISLDYELEGLELATDQFIARCGAADERLRWMRSS